MADKPNVKKGDYIRMIASLAGGDFSYAPGQVLLVGTHIDVAMANALVAEPAEDPRAAAIDEAEAKRILQSEVDPTEVQSAQETPPPAPPRYWSDMAEQELLDDLAFHLKGLNVEAVRAWTEEPEGDAFVELADGRTLRFTGQHEVVVWQAVDTSSDVEQEVTQAVDTSDVDTNGEEGQVEERQEGGEPQNDGAPEAGMEKATQPEAETRETATAPQTRGKRKKPTPPDDK